MIGRTWAPIGETPILKHHFRRGKLSVISAITPNPHIYLLTFPGSIASAEIIRFLKHLLHWIPGIIFLLWDGYNPHKSKITQSFIQRHSKRLKVYPLPAYAPELNPDEGVWAYLKGYALLNFCPADLRELKNAICKAVIGIRRRPTLIRSFFNACKLPF